MKYYLVTDTGVQWFTYLIAMCGDAVSEVIEANHLPDGSLIRNIHGREPVDKWLRLRDGRIILGGGDFGGWNISQLEFERLKRLIELTPAITEYNKLKDSV